MSNHPTYEAAEAAFKAVDGSVVAAEFSIYAVTPIRLYKKA